MRSSRSRYACEEQEQGACEEQDSEETVLDQDQLQQDSPIREGHRYRVLPLSVISQL